MTKIIYTIDGQTSTITEDSELTAMRKLADVLDKQGIVIADSNMSKPMIDDQIKMAGQEVRITFEVSEE